MIQLQLETIAICNAACVFCPYPTMKRAKGVMSDALFEKIVVDAADIPFISELSFQGLGEPTLDRKIVDRIKFAKDVKRGWMTTMFTNGHTLTADLAARLERAGLNKLYVSINASTPTGRKAVMKLDDYDKVVEATRAAMENSKYMRVVPKGVVGMDIFAGQEVDDFKRFWGETAFLHLEGNWAGATYDIRRPKEVSCRRALTQIMVLWDGRVSLCCFDGEGEVIFGDLNKQTIREVYNSPEASRYREAHATGDRTGLKLCGNCTEI